MTEYPLLPLPRYNRAPRPTSHQFPPASPHRATPERQSERLGQQFDRLQSILQRDSTGLSLRDDPAGIAPERAVVLEVAGSIRDFHLLTRQIPGLEFLADEEAIFDADEDFYYFDTRKSREGEPRMDKPVSGRLYLAMPDVQALRRLLTLWRRWLRNESFQHGDTQWRTLFSSLRDIRSWGPQDRVTEEAIEIWRDTISDDTEKVTRIEAELWFYENSARRLAEFQKLQDFTSSVGGQIVHHSCIPEIGYDAVLVDLPTSDIRRLIEHDTIELALNDHIMFLRPQSCMDNSELSDESTSRVDDPGGYPEESPPIAALLDGIPVQNHELLQGRIDIDDPENMDDISVVSQRYHGTAIASLIIHGDKTLKGPPLSRKLHIRPVLYTPGDQRPEEPRSDRLLIDQVYRAVRRIKEGEGESEATAPEVFLINISLGDLRRPFSGRMSPWGKLLDYLAIRFAVLFLVSAGNIKRPLPMNQFSNWTSFEDACAETRERAVLEALGEQRAFRTLLSPAEAMNVITVGASHHDSIAPNSSRGAMAQDPFKSSHLPNISSALGLGHRKAVKPDINLPGGREHVTFRWDEGQFSIIPGGRYGLQAATPDPLGSLDLVRPTDGTSAATALATRAAHQIFEALVDSDDGPLRNSADRRHYAVVIKALLVHRSNWGDRAGYLDSLYGPHGRGQHVPRRDNIARLLGYGFPDVGESMECARNRATMVGHGDISANQANVHRIPLPPSLENVTEPRSLSITVAWFSPFNRRHQTYHQAKLEVSTLENIDDGFGVNRVSDQPSDKTTPRGTVFHTRYCGDKSVMFVDDGHVVIRVFCREQAGPMDRTIPYGIAVTIEAGLGVPVYNEIRTRLALRVGAQARV